MFTRFVTTAAFAAMVLAPVAVSASSPGMKEPDKAAAIAACLDFNASGPARLVDVVDDGLGDYLVWIEDGKGGLWACNASGYGDVYASLRIGSDLLDGKGRDLIHRVADTGWDSPSLAAGRVCTAMARDDAVRIVATVADGLAGYLVWLESGAGDLTLCNANGHGEVFAFQGVEAPINKPGTGGLVG